MSAVARSSLIETSPTPAERVGVLESNTGIPVGQKIPDVHARDLDGNDVALSSLYAKGPILLVFYRGGWCPFCNSEIHALTMAFPDYQKRGVTPVAVSVDMPTKEAQLKATYAIPFPVLSDTDLGYSLSLGLIFWVGVEISRMYQEAGVELEKYHGNQGLFLPMAAKFIVGQDGLVKARQVNIEFRERMEPEAIVAALKDLQAASRPASDHTGALSGQ